MHSLILSLFIVIGISFVDGVPKHWSRRHHLHRKGHPLGFFDMEKKILQEERLLEEIADDIAWNERHIRNKLHHRNWLSRRGLSLQRRTVREKPYLKAGDELSLKAGKAIVIGLLAEGGFGQVFEAKIGDNIIAIKASPKYRINEQTKAEEENPSGIMLKNEANILAVLKDKAECKGHLVNMLEVLEKDDVYYMAMEKYSGSLFDYDDKRDVLRSEASSIMKGILQGVYCLHNNKFVHYDLKPDNILVKPGSKGGEVVVADLGHADSIYGTQTYKPATTFYGSSDFQYLFINDAASYDMRVSDIYSVCLTMIFLYMKETDFPPREHFYTKDVYDMYEFVTFTTEFFEKHRITTEAADLMQRLCYMDLKQRITAKDALDHPFITGGKLDDFIAKHGIPTAVDKHGRQREYVKYKASSTVHPSSSSSSISTSSTTLLTTSSRPASSTIIQGSDKQSVSTSSTLMSPVSSTTVSVKVSSPSKDVSALTGTTSVPSTSSGTTTKPRESGTTAGQTTKRSSTEQISTK